MSRSSCGSQTRAPQIKTLPVFAYDQAIVHDPDGRDGSDSRLRLPKLTTSKIRRPRQHRSADDADVDVNVEGFFHVTDGHVDERC